MHNYHEEYTYVRVLRIYCNENAIRSQIILKHSQRSFFSTIIPIILTRIQTVSLIERIAVSLTSSGKRIIRPLKNSTGKTYTGCAALV